MVLKVEQELCKILQGAAALPAEGGLVHRMHSAISLVLLDASFSFIIE